MRMRVQQTLTRNVEIEVSPEELALLQLYRSELQFDLDDETKNAVDSMRDRIMGRAVESVETETPRSVKIAVMHGSVAVILAMTP